LHRDSASTWLATGIRPRGATSALKLQSTLAAGDASSIDPLHQDVFVQIRNAKNDQVLCARVPSTSFKSKHKSFTFRDTLNLVPSAKGLSDMTVKVRRSGKVSFRTHGKRVQLAGAIQGTFQITIGFRDQARLRRPTAARSCRSDSAAGPLAPCWRTEPLLPVSPSARPRLRAPACRWLAHDRAPRLAAAVPSRTATAASGPGAEGQPAVLPAAEVSRTRYRAPSGSGGRSNA
jgi:hypothetical protein